MERSFKMIQNTIFKAVYNCSPRLQHLSEGHDGDPQAVLAGHGGRTSVAGLRRLCQLLCASARLHGSAQLGLIEHLLPINHILEGLKL